ncbi:hypothetical protein HRI_003072900 [Hibiscus trionum]|uniref:Uncharacterized protein n=1 Tax=Hibiscus trionum TaxID=183268 RepID=A0A9W7IEX8_HIBTR|nr:hypothetical protein HRI_003072900 [Hibiscus trionum]
MVDGVQTRSQHDQAKMQTDFKELEKRLEDKIEKTLNDKVADFRSEVTGVRSEIRELRNLFEKFLGQSEASKGILGTSPLAFCEMSSAEPTASGSRPTDESVLRGDSGPRPYKLQCPTFDGTNFRDWWSKLEQFFSTESVPDDAKVKLVMLNLEDKAL